MSSTVFVGCGFAAKYRLGGGNFSVPMQWVRGLIRLGEGAVWLEYLFASKDPEEDRLCIRAFQRRMKFFGLADRYCLIYQPGKECNLDGVEFFGMTRQQFEDRLAGSNTLLNLSYSIRPPLIERFERRILCDLDPCEFAYWMNQMEMGQSWHHEFYTIGLNRYGADCRMPPTPVPFKTFPPVVDTTLVKAAPRPEVPRFTTIGQWWWDGCVQVDGEYPDLSKRTAFEPYMTLPSHVPEAHMELAMNLAEGEHEEREKILAFGWTLAVPHKVARSPGHYYRYVRSSMAEFTLPKGIESVWRSGWVSDRAITFLASGRPSISADVGAAPYLPEKSGLIWFTNFNEAVERVREVMADWDRISRISREMAEEVFDAPVVLKRILGGI